MVRKQVKSCRKRHGTIQLKEKVMILETCLLCDIVGHRLLLSLVQMCKETPHNVLLSALKYEENLSLKGIYWNLADI